MTNGDKIRAMTDEELSIFMDKGCASAKYLTCRRTLQRLTNGTCDDRKCRDCWLEWLREEVDDECPD